MGGERRSRGGPTRSDSPGRQRHRTGSQTSGPTVGFALYQGCTLLDFAGATQVFAGWAAHWNPVWLAPVKRQVRTSENVSVVPNYSFEEEHPHLDILFVPGGEGDGVAAVMLDKKYLQWLRRTSRRTQMTGGVCVGSFILAAAGLLDGFMATTHWLQLDNLRRFPGVEVVDGYPRWCIDPGGTRFTGGGVSSSIDLALELVRRTSGLPTASDAELIIQYAPGPSLRSGDPTEAPPAVVERVREDSTDFVQEISAAIDKILG